MRDGGWRDNIERMYTPSPLWIEPLKMTSLAAIRQARAFHSMPIATRNTRAKTNSGYGPAWNNIAWQNFMSPEFLLISTSDIELPPICDVKIPSFFWGFK